MKTLSSAFIIVFLSCYSITYSQNGDLTVKVTNVKTATGKMEIGLYDEGENFPKNGYALQYVKIPVNSVNFEYTFKNIPLTTYGIVLYHDANGDGELNKNLIGWPLESYGFSNNIRPISVPPFKKVAFDFNKSKTIVIELID